MQLISVIIPTLNEAAHIAWALEDVHRGRNVEAIVVDGGSADATTRIAASAGAAVIAGPAGRARQMNNGAATANGELLLFLHADTRLPRGFDSHIRRLLSRPGTAAGAFAFRIDAPSWQFRLIERAVNFRARCLQLPYGDQAIFIKAETLRDVGGFPDIPVMEDYELMRRLQRRGRVVIAPVPAVTSARSWSHIGIWQTTLINQITALAYGAGIPPTRIERWRRYCGLSVPNIQQGQVATSKDS